MLQIVKWGCTTPATLFSGFDCFALYFTKFTAMEGEILVIKKNDLIEIMEGFNLKIASQFTSRKQNKDVSKDSPKVKRLSTRQIKDILGVGDTTFEKIQNDLPLHRTKTGRLFGYEHDIIIHLFREHPPYFDYTKFWDYVNEENLVKHMSGNSK